MTIFTQDPQARLDYANDWTRWLPPGDALMSSTWVSSDPDLILENQELSPTVTRIWIRGGIENIDYYVTNHIVTVAARETDLTWTIRIRQL